MFAQNEIDSLYRKHMVVEDDTTNIVPDSIPYLATDFIRQRRYLPKGVPFHLRRLNYAEGEKPDSIRWWERLFVGASSGLFGLTDKEWQATNVPIEGSLGYHINHFSSVRLSGRYVMIPRKETRLDMRSFGVDLDYMFNLTNYVRGFDPERIFSISVVPGIGYIHSEQEGLHANSFQVHLGAHAGFRFSNTELYVEPWFGVVNDRVNMSDNPSYYDVLYGVKVGAAVHLHPLMRRASRDSLNHNPFFEYSQGMIAIHRPSETWGTGYQISVGTWINPYLGIRAGVAGRNFYWSGKYVPTQKTEWQAGMFLGGRVEALLNPLNLLEQWRMRQAEHRFGITLSLGAEYGWMIKYGMEGTQNGLRKAYYGVTAATQVHYALSKHTELFVEPRATLIKYAIPYTNSAFSKSFTDKELGISAGVRLQPYTRQERLANVASDWDNWALRRLSLMAAFGGARHVRASKLVGESSFNMNLQLGAAYEFSPSFTLRMRAEYLRYVFNQQMSYKASGISSSTTPEAMFRRTHHVLSLKAGYMLNLNNLLQGYDANRKFNVYLEAGPMYSMIVKRRDHVADNEIVPKQGILWSDPTQNIKSSLGVFGGVVAEYKLNRHWSVLAQSEMSAHVRRDFLSAPGGFAGPLNNWLLQASVGAAYHFGDFLFEKNGERDTTTNHKPFFEFSQGMVAIHRPEATWGTGYQVSIGTWFNPVFGVRGGFAGRNFYWAGRVMPAQKAGGVQVHPEKTEWQAGTYMGLRAEALLNPLNLFEQYREKNSKFSLNFSLGMEAGRMIKYGSGGSEGIRRYYYGITGSAQALYALSPRTEIFVQPRLSMLHYTLGKSNYEGWDNVRDKEADIFIGVRLQPYMRSEKQANDAFFDYSPSLRHLSLMAAFGGARHVRASKLRGDAAFNMNLQVGAAYEFAPLFKLRLRAEYLRYVFNQQTPYKLNGTGATYSDLLFRNTHHLFTLKAGYMLNLNNLLQGYDANRKFNVYLEAGPMYSYIVRQRDHLADGEMVPKQTVSIADPTRDIKSSLGLYGAVVAEYKLNKNWSVLAQSEMSGHLRRNFLSASGGFGGVLNNWLVQTSIGAAYHFGDFLFEKNGERDTTTNHNLFYEFSQGMVAVHRPADTWGTGYQVSVGTWLNPVFGVRGGFAGRNFYWGARTISPVKVYGIQVHPGKTEWYAGTYMGLRMEALLNPLNLFEQYREKNSKFSLNFSLGMEAGRMIKYGTYSSEGLRRYYYGFTGSAQVLYALSRRAELFIQPRLSLINYTLPESNMSGWKRYTDKEADMYVGIRLQPFSRSEKKEVDDFYDDTPSLSKLSLMAAVGGTRQVRVSKVLGEGLTDWHLKLGAAYEFSPYARARIRFEYLQYKLNQQLNYQVYDYATPITYNAFFHNKYTFLTTKVGYMLNLNNVIQGYDADRKLNVYVEAGPMYSWNLSRKYEFADGELVGGSDYKIIDPTLNVKNSFGIFGGIVAEYRLTRNWSVLAETEMSAHFREGILQNTGFAGPMKNWLLQLSVGGAYNF